MSRSTGEIISQTVRSLLADAVSEERDALAVNTPRQVYTRKQNELADFLGVSRPYLPRKIEAGTWTSRDLDRLATFFDLCPMDFVPGPDDDWGPVDEASEGVRQAKGSCRGSTPRRKHSKDSPSGSHTE